MCVLDDKCIVARKEHICDDCGSLIRKGETYRKQEKKDDVIGFCYKNYCYRCSDTIKLVTPRNNKNISTCKKVLTAIVDYIQEHGYSPTTRELAKKANINSQGSLDRYLRILYEEGMIETDHKGSSRAIRVSGYKFEKILND